MTTKEHVARAYGAFKDLMALVGVAAIVAVLVLPLEREAGVAAAGGSEPDGAVAALTMVQQPEAAEPVVAMGETVLPEAPVEVEASVAAEAVAETAPEPAAAAVQTAAAVDAVLQPEQRAISAFIARRYRVAERAVEHFVSTAYRAGAQYSIDPLLILAVMAVESGYNPVAKSVVGAKGLMQVLPRWHPEKLADHGGETALLEPEVNIFVGTRILREYLDRFRDTEAALQMYVGALGSPTSRYAAKVLAEKARLEAALRRALGKRQSV